MASSGRSAEVVETSRQRIQATAESLRRLTRESIQVGWRGNAASAVTSSLPTDEVWLSWPIAPLNSRQHLAWSKGGQSLWLCQRVRVPEAVGAFPVGGFSLRLGLTWWAEQAQIWVDGTLRQVGDLFDCFTRLSLSDRAQPGDTFTIMLYLVSPQHDDGALVRSELIYESRESGLPEPGFVADELVVLATYLEKQAPERLASLAEVIEALDWRLVSCQADFLAALATLRQRLMPFSDWIKQRQIYCLGHAHLDLAWLWPVAETWQAAERTFESVLSLQQSFPELTYTHSSPALLSWLEQHRPVLFQRVKQAVAEKRWAIDAGLWVEPELNLAGGESLARQILYGQRYCQERFGMISALAWLPDSFGFSWQLPQLFRLGGVEYFATQKLRWNDTTEFPHHLFWWQGLDGTRILSLMLPPIGRDIEPTAIAQQGAIWEAETGRRSALWLPGVGDHGGGPTRDMLEKARRWSQSPFFPKLSFTLAKDFCQEMAAPAPLTGDAEQGAIDAAAIAANGQSSADALPVWNDELYLELHRGCYTVHADQKQYNRHCEDWLWQAEVMAAIANLTVGHPYPQARLEAAWKQVLFNQFHDILPGTAIPEVFETANRDWLAARQTAQQTFHDSVQAVLGAVVQPPQPQATAIPIWVFNTLSWVRAGVVSLQLPPYCRSQPHWQVWDAAGSRVKSQMTAVDAPQGGEAACPQLLFWAAAVPPVGYQLFWLVPVEEAAEAAAPSQLQAPWCLENEWLRVEVDAETGDLRQVWNKPQGKAVLRAAGNQLQAFQDAGQYWDAWNIAPDYGSHPLPSPELKHGRWLERGPVRQRLRVVRQLGPSVFQQDYVLDCHTPYLQIETVADWQASQVLLKAAFPLQVWADQATYEIPFGAIARPTQSQDSHQQAKWEVPALRWADLSDEQCGVSLLMDYKHGLDVKPDQLRLTLLKAPVWPDPKADRGRHHFTYALYPHVGDWRRARTPHHAIAFNIPLHAICCEAGLPASGADQAAIQEHQSFLALENENLGLAAFKRAEDGSSDWILRCWDMYGEPSQPVIKTAFQVKEMVLTDLLEFPLETADESVYPWQIFTYRLSMAGDCNS